MNRDEAVKTLKEDIEKIDNDQWISNKKTRAAMQYAIAVLATFKADLNNAYQAGYNMGYADALSED